MPKQKEEQKGIIAIDISLPTEVKSSGVAYYRLNDDMYDFMNKVLDKNTILGFEWNGSRNFGFIFKEK
jgi:hypothetical protein